MVQISMHSTAKWAALDNHCHPAQIALPQPCLQALEADNKGRRLPAGYTNAQTQPDGSRKGAPYTFPDMEPPRVDQLLGGKPRAAKRVQATFFASFLGATKKEGPSGRDMECFGCARTQQWLSAKGVLFIFSQHLRSPPQQTKTYPSPVCKP